MILRLNYGKKQNTKPQVTPKDLTNLLKRFVYPLMNG